MAEQRSIDFIERVDIAKELKDALVMSREAVGLGINGELESMAGVAQFVFPKLRFVWLCMQRYVFASKFLRDDDFVIDAPCGTGYGTAILASNGNQVLGIDIHAPTIAEASDTFKYPNIEFMVGDMTKCGFPKVDFITCLDGLEHVVNGAALIEDFAEALFPSGILVVSVPINETLITGGQENPFHEEDYDYDKLHSLLNALFGKVTIFGHDVQGSISDASFAFDGLTAVCEV